MKKTISILLACVAVLALTAGCGQKIYTASDRDAVSINSEIMANPDYTVTDDSVSKQVKFAYPATMTVVEPDKETLQNQLFCVVDNETGSRITLLAMGIASGGNAADEANAMLGEAAFQKVIDVAKEEFTALYGEEEDFSFGSVPVSKPEKYGNCLGVNFSYSVQAKGETYTYYHVVINGSAPDKTTEKGTITYQDNVVYVFIFEAAGGDMDVFGGAEKYMVVR